MKRIAVLVLGLAGGIAVSSPARVGVEWYWDAELDSHISCLHAPDRMLPSNRTVQLIWSPDNTASPPNPVDLFTPTAGEIALDSRPTSGDGYWDFGLHYYGTAGQYVNGYVYQRIWDIPWGEQPPPDVRYEDGDVTGPLRDADAMPPQQPNVCCFWTSTNTNWFVVAGGLLGAYWTVAGNPASHGISSPFAYGTNFYAMLSTTVTASVTTPADASPGTRHACAGWRLDGCAGSSNGAGNSVTFYCNSAWTITWEWTNEYLLDTCAARDGTVSPDDSWLTNGQTATVTASPQAFCSFAGWSGDVPPGGEMNNPLIFPMDRPRLLTASFSATDSDSDDLPDWWESSFYGDTTAASRTNDSDEDGMNSWAEYKAGTDPTNRLSRMEFTACRPGSETNVLEFAWASVSNRTYAVDESTNLQNAAGFSAVLTNLPATPPCNTLSVTSAMPSVFHRIRVE